MDTEPRRGPGRPRKVVVESEAASPDQAASGNDRAEREAGGSDAKAARFAGSWAEALGVLSALDGMPTRITFPGECPELYSTNHFGCPVVRGDRFTVRMADGRLIEP